MLEPTKSAQKSAEDAKALNAKVIDHAEENVREAFNALRSAATAGSVTDVMKASGDYVKAQGERSMAQAKEIGEMIANFGRNAVSGWGIGGSDDTGGTGGTGGKKK